ncbi:MAG: thymidylate kinase [Candidatus Thermoplasmatota archaeon]
MRLIIVDGLDGVGKDTHAELIKKRYDDLGENVVIRSHPTSDNFFGRKAKKALLSKSKINKVKASFFYMFDVLRSVKKFYRRDDVDTLIMVRYLMGTAYLPSFLVNIGYRFFFNLVPTSVYLFFLDAPPEELVKRVSVRSETEMFENLEEFRKIRKKALPLVDRWYVIDTTGSIEKTFSDIESILDSLDKEN